MKYYGIKQKIKQEDYRYLYQKSYAWIQAKIPGKSKKKHKEWYTEQYTKESFRRNKIKRIVDSKIPDGRKCELHCIVTSDLIRREDIFILQKGIRKLLKQFRTSKYIGIQHDSLEQIEDKIKNADSTLPQYYRCVECGLFDFTGNVLQNDIDYYEVRIRNINTEFLSIEFVIFLTEEKTKELNKLIEADYQDNRGYPMSYLMEKKGRGSTTGYTVSYYSEPALKADKIFEFLSYIQWQFYDAISGMLPFVLHRMGRMPPRIDVFKTDIDYREECGFFWESIGVATYQGQFVDENHKFFFKQSLSGRYEGSHSYQRLIYIYREDGKTQYEDINVDYEVYDFIRNCGDAFFAIMFSDALVEYTSEMVVHYKREVNQIQLRRNLYRRLLKERYEYERGMDLFHRYTKDDPVRRARDKLEELFLENDRFIKEHRSNLFYGWKLFYDTSAAKTQKLSLDMDLLTNGFDRKQSILQRLFDYKNVRITWIIGSLTLIIAALTLIATIDPEHGKGFLDCIKGFFGKNN